MSLRVLVIASSGGAAFAEVHALLRDHGVAFRVITDRACGIEARCDALGVPLERIVWTDRPGFCGAVLARAAQWGADAGLMFFTRLVGEPLLGQLACINVHPGLLPAFPGLRAVEQAHAARVRWLGATAHLATAAMDEGPVIVQTAAPVDPEAPLAHWQHRSFVQKTKVAATALDLVARGAVRLDARAGSVHWMRPTDAWDDVSPGPADAGLRRRLSQWQRREEAVAHV